LQDDLRVAVEGHDCLIQAGCEAGRVTFPLARRVYDTCHLTGRFRLRSGQISGEYFDKYLFEGQPDLLRKVAEAMVALLPECDVLAGMEMGGIPLATVMSQLTGLPTVYVRKHAKAYGTNKVAEGGPVNGRSVVLIEDVVTTGGALLASCGQLRSIGAQVETVVCAIDREQGGRQNLATEALQLRAALTRRDLETSVMA
jgi:orotate phosphoribosyltransferase